ncbi:hypothetical protein [Sphingosinicella terrae]|uniref:hypothetical protein n=1 Tax=Sphingosinicella terrae TaxID=2172047 RepID=UPI000E0DD579|nr:hypothetical protein [Sphingosinicella terrae]
MRDHHRRQKWPPRRQAPDGAASRTHPSPRPVAAKVAEIVPILAIPVLGLAAPGTLSRFELASIVEGVVG